MEILQNLRVERGFFHGWLIRTKKLSFSKREWDYESRKKIDFQPKLWAFFCETEYFFKINLPVCEEFVTVKHDALILILKFIQTSKLNHANWYLFKLYRLCDVESIHKLTLLFRMGPKIFEFTNNSSGAFQTRRSATKKAPWLKIVNKDLNLPSSGTASYLHSCAHVILALFFFFFLMHAFLN